MSTATPGGKTDLVPVLRALLREPGPTAFIHPPCVNTRLVSLCTKAQFQDSIFFLPSTNTARTPLQALPRPCLPAYATLQLPLLRSPSDGDHPLPPRDKREPLPAQRVARRLRAEGTKRNQPEDWFSSCRPHWRRPDFGLPPHLPNPNPTPGGSRGSGSRPPLA